ncbi:hypothetical protein ABL78_0387 [Leptomonas seymouri]|uniref:Uncharacterized protein n=1 Tax=Leptomonas seymouri TaxID=5684 RepID=A0A0N0P998_LEPSE|nr:hypothetical protein ABL78_0387 [Leptomonas seymouri]|eukprot:KPI90457.1 hypothetical protein ABL78_0387 [Leptomonas seymouri]
MHPSLRIMALQLPFFDGVRWSGCLNRKAYCQAKRFMSGIPSSRTSNDAMSSETTATQRRSVKPEAPLVDWTPGIDYYFSKEEEERFLIPCALGASGITTQNAKRDVGREGNNATNSTEQANGDDGVGAAGQKPSTLVEIKGTLRSFLIDTAVPPLRREEVERWRLESCAFMKGMAVRRRVLSPREMFLLPRDAMVTYLGDDMHKLDQLYRQFGLYTPSEVAEALFPYVPTFQVDSRVVMQTVPISLFRKVEQDWGPGSFSFYIFARYPMLFLYSYSRYDRSPIQLNSGYWFVRQHPSYGKADSALRKHRIHERVGITRLESATLPFGSKAAPLALDRREGDGSETESDATAAQSSGLAAARQLKERMPLSVKLFHALVRNLPRFPTPPSEVTDDTAATLTATQTPPYMKNRYAPLNLVKWINSFPPDDAKLFHSVPEQLVVRVLSQYVNVFQLMSLTKSDPNIFVEGSVLLAEREQRKAAKKSSGPEASSARGGYEVDEDESNDDVTSAEGWDGDDQLCTATANEAVSSQTTMARGNAAETPACPSASTSTVAAERSARFQQAIVDDLIDVEGILTGPQSDFAAVELPAAAAAGPPALEDAGAADRTAVAESSNLTNNDDRSGSFWDEEDGRDTEDADNDADRHGRDCSQPRLANMSNGDYRGSDEREGSASSAGGLRAPLPHGASVDDVTVFGLPLEEIYVRRLPRNVAPRSLSDWDETTSPDVELAALAARFLAPPPSLARGSKFDNFFGKSAHQYNPFAPPLMIWRWVSVERLYHGYTVEQRHYLRREYKGLVNFLRYHGKLFELSNDLLYVIAHDPEGQLAPIPFMERRFNSGERVVLPRTFDDNADPSASQVGEKDRLMFSRILGEGHIPTCRRQLLLLDPHNPIFLPDVLHEEIANLLPEHPVRLTQIMHRLPPVMRAALPYRSNFRVSKFLNQTIERGVTMLQRRPGGERPNMIASAKTPMSVEDAIAEILQLPIGPEGVTVRALRYMHLSAPAVDTLCDHYGSLRRAIDAYPQYFQQEIQTIRNRASFVIRFRK